MICMPCRGRRHGACPEVSRQGDPGLTVVILAGSQLCDCQHGGGGASLASGQAPGQAPLLASGQDKGGAP